MHGALSWRRLGGFCYDIHGFCMSKDIDIEKVEREWGVAAVKIAAEGDGAVLKWS